MEIGIKGKQERIVTKEMTAESLSSGLLPVFATPCMIQFMEETSRLSVEPFLPSGQSTVGILVNVKHLASTFVGCLVTCESELIEIDCRRLVFPSRSMIKKNCWVREFMKDFSLTTQNFWKNWKRSEKIWRNFTARNDSHHLNCVDNRPTTSRAVIFIQRAR